MIDPLTNSWPNPYSDVWHFFKTHHLPSERGDWRLTEYELGEIQGLPKSRGRVVATNGIMCYIQVSPDILYYGHYTAWVPDEVASVGRKVSRANFTPSAKKVDVLFVEY